MIEPVWKKIPQFGKYNLNYYIMVKESLFWEISSRATIITN
jgi:hypothetical protein